MENEFITYELALRMKALGFDEPCMGVYYGDEDDIQFSFDRRETQYYVQKGYKNGILVPTFSQAFRWFRDKLKDSALEPYDMVKHYAYNMKVSWEEAELECLEKLIEIVEQKEK
jgi:hypothetical protein